MAEVCAPLSAYLVRKYGELCCFSVVNIFQVRRAAESIDFRSDIGNVRLLSHASSVENFVGVLSRSVHTFSLSVCLSRSPPLSVFVSLSVNGLDLSALDSGFNAVISNNILYALPVYCGYLTQGHKEMLQRIFKRANRRGFTVHEYDLEALA